MSNKKMISEKEAQEISEAIKALEAETNGELVPVLAQRSDAYPAVSLRLAYMLGVVSLVIAASLSWLWLLPASLDPFALCMAIAFTMLAAYFTPLVFPGLIRYLIRQDVMETEVLQAAKEAFLEYELFATEKRIGILIYVSMLEHRVVVLGDKGINSVIDDGEWDSVVELVIDGIKRKDPASGIIAGINECKKILLKHGFHDEGGKNELEDRVVTK